MCVRTRGSENVQFVFFVIVIPCRNMPSAVRLLQDRKFVFLRGK